MPAGNTSVAALKVFFVVTAISPADAGSIGRGASPSGRESTKRDPSPPRLTCHGGGDRAACDIEALTHGQKGRGVTRVEQSDATIREVATQELAEKGIEDRAREWAIADHMRSCLTHTLAQQVEAEVAVGMGEPTLGGLEHRASVADRPRILDGEIEGLHLAPAVHCIGVARSADRGTHSRWGEARLVGDEQVRE